jgi:hypothetical protein
MIVGRETNKDKLKPQPPKPSSDVPTAEEIGGASGSTGGSGRVKIRSTTQSVGAGRGEETISEFLSVDEAKNLIQKSLATNDAKTYNKIIRAIGPGYTKRQYESIWREAVDWAVWNNATPFQAIKSANFDIGVLQDYKPAGAGKTYTPTESVRQYTPTEGRNTAVEVFQSYLQRNPTKQEIEDFTKALNNAAIKNPTTTTTKIVKGKAQTTTTGGFDLKAWAQGYVSARFADEGDSLAQRQTNELRSIAKQYGVNMGDNWYSSAGVNVMRGQDPERYINDIKQQSASRYRAYADRINAGDTLERIASPYINAYANLLEINPYDVDVFDNTIQQALLSTDEKGNNVPRNLFQFELDLKKDPRWLNTKNAQQTYSGLASKILGDFGLMG